MEDLVVQLTSEHTLPIPNKIAHSHKFISHIYKLDYSLKIDT